MMSAEVAQRSWQYGAIYVALAEALDAPLLTADLRLADGVRRFTSVEVTAS